MPEETLILDSAAMQRAIARISYEIIERNKGIENLCLIGIYTRGVALAQRIAGKMQEVEGKEVPVGKLDITVYRDDRREKGGEDRSDIPFEVTDRKVVLVDDVIYTGRSARAAMEAIMSRGRPIGISLAVLVDRGHRELPIRADFVGKNLPTSKNEKVRVRMTETDREDKVMIIKGEKTECQGS